MYTRRVVVYPCGSDRFVDRGRPPGDRPRKPASGGFEDTIAQLVNAIGYAREQQQTCPMIVIPPESSEVACGVLAVLHWRIGHFPSLLRWHDGGPVEVVNLQLIRSRALGQRYPDR
jgi:hypothetical protein